MKKEFINEMKSQKRLTLTFKQMLTHYFIVLFLLLIPILAIIDLYQIYILQNYHGIRSEKELITSSLPFLALALIFVFIQYRRLDFKKIQIRYTNDQFKEALRRTTSKLNWKIKTNNEQLLIAYRPNDCKSGSWGEMITIIRENDFLLLNSICDPNSTSSVVSFGSNSRNLKVFMNNLTDTIQEIPVIEKVDPKITNWTFKEIILRVLLYPFCLFLIVFGFYLLFDTTTFRSTFAGIAAIVASIFYFYSDITLVLKNKKSQSPSP